MRWASQKPTDWKARPLYRVYAKVKYWTFRRAKGHKCAILFDMSQRYWGARNSSLRHQQNPGPRSTPFDFRRMTEMAGNRLCVLGFVTAARINGGYSTGTAPFRQCERRKVTDELFMQESTIRLFVEPSWGLCFQSETDYRMASQSRQKWQGLMQN